MVNTHIRGKGGHVAIFYIEVVAKVISWAFFLLGDVVLEACPLNCWK